MELFSSTFDTFFFDFLKMIEKNVKLLLYSYARSSCSWRVRSALHYKQLPFETRSVFIYGGEQHGPEYRRLNPGRMVPALVVIEEDNNSSSKTLFESLAIIDYLEQRFPSSKSQSPPLVPNGSDSVSFSQRASVLAVAQAIVSGIQPLQNMAVMQFAADFALKESSSSASTSKSDQAQLALAWSRHWITTKFARLETILEPLSTTEKYCVGDRLTLADLCLVPQVYNAVHYGVDVEGQFRLINKLYNRLLAEEECIRLGRPEAQPDWDPQRERAVSGF